MQETVSRIQRKNNPQIDLTTTYHKLNAFIDKVNDKIINRIQLVQQVYLEDYKQQVNHMAEELKKIRGLLDQELLRQRSNERLFFLEEERDFFRGQTMKLNEELTHLNKVNEKMQVQLEQAEAEAKNYKNLVYGLQKKAAKMQSEIFETQKLKESMKMPAVDKRQNLSISPTKTTLTRYSPGLDNGTQSKHRLSYKSIQLRKSLSKQLLDNQLKRRDEILEQCIKDIKKKIFYRTAAERQPSKIHFDQEKKVTFDKFTRTDKQELIRSILSNQQLLGEFHAFMISKKGEDQSTRKMFNSKSKAIFSDKLFKIKLSGLNPN